MQYATHPDDERLAAYAGADRDAIADRELADHVASCDRCRPIVDELTVLRGALSRLPDIAPSRPLRLVPPAPAIERRSGSLDWLRRLAAPAMVAGAGLVLVGAVGVSGTLGGLSGTAVDLEASQASSNGAKAPGVGGAHSPVPAVSSDNEFGTRSNPPRDNASATPKTPAPSPGAVHTPDRGSTEQPWLTFLIAGVGLFGIAAILRFSLAPRAG